MACHAGHLLLDVQLLSPALVAQLSLLASYGSSNLRSLSVHGLVTHMLPRLLPSSWRQAAVAAWQAGQDEGSGVTW